MVFLAGGGNGFFFGFWGGGEMQWGSLGVNISFVWERGERRYDSMKKRFCDLGTLWNLRLFGLCESLRGSRLEMDSVRRL